MPQLLVVVRINKSTNYWRSPMEFNQRESVARTVTVALNCAITHTHTFGRRGAGRAGLGDRAASANVAVLSFVALTGFLIGPPLIGFVAEHAGIRIGIACVVPFLLLSLLLTGRLVPKPVKSTHNPEAEVPGVL